MHPSLRFENLSKISNLLHRSLDRDPEVLRQLCAKIVPLSDAHATQFLPVFHAALDPAHIPTTDDMDAKPHSPSTTQALGVMRGQCTYEASSQEAMIATISSRSWASYTSRRRRRGLITPWGREAASCSSVEGDLELRVAHDISTAFTGLAVFISGGNIQGDVALYKAEHLEEFVDGAEHFTEKPGSLTWVLNAALLEQGIVPTLIAILDVAIKHQECPSLLYVKPLSLLRSAGGCGRPSSAVSFRFLRAVALSLVYYPIVMQIESVSKWVDVLELVEKRVTIRRQIDSEQYQSLWACNSLKHTTALENAKRAIGTRVIDSYARDFDAVVKLNPKL
ncbi:hypothetical protein B0H13DRAFT_2322062 [Mycena leptocephala]|nr:hypothetical protein B0H13DRAFT_2322062 [Mycena leptocephala]